MNSYNSDSIIVLKGLEAVRIRPAMYIGDVDKKGLHHLIWECVDNSIDEAMSGYCDEITVILHEDGETITVVDNGRGIPVDIHKEYIEEQKTALEIVLTKLHAGGKFNNKGYKSATGGLHGVGVSCVNALSDKLIAVVWRDGGEFKQEFEKGVPITKCERIGDSTKTGTSITFHPDKTIFKNSIKYDEEIIIKRLRESAFLNAGLTINFINKKTKREEKFQFQGGIKDYIVYLNKDKIEHYPKEPFYFKGNNNDVIVECAFQYTNEDDEMILSFANNINTHEGGTHLSGFKTALTRAVNNYAKNNNYLKNNDPNLNGDDIREGITAIISVKLFNPLFEGQTKTKLGTSEIEGIVSSLLQEAFILYFDKNPEIIKTIIDRALLAYKAREAAKKQSELIKRKTVFGKNNRLPGKLKDCISESNKETEIFIVEGDSAAGSAIEGRDSYYQAVLPIKGKIINAEKKDLESLLKNDEIQALINAIGTGIILEDNDVGFNINNLRYNKIIFLTDADSDGGHIATLLMTFFYKFMRPLIEQGHVYIAKPPLFKVELNNKEYKYCWTKEEIEQLQKQYRGKIKVIRFKGLGEMNSDELAETSMDKKTRKLIKVSIEDLVETNKIVSILMGKNVQVRKEFIINYKFKNKSMEK